MADFCTAHEERNRETAELKAKIELLMDEKEKMWDEIRDNKNNLSSLSRQVIEVEARASNIYDMLEKIDNKLEKYLESMTELNERFLKNEYETERMSKFVDKMTFGKLAGLALVIISILVGLATLINMAVGSPAN